MRLAAYLAVFGMCCGAFGDAAGAGTLLEWAELPELPPPPGADRQLGLAGPFVGVDGDALIVAGGANFPEPVWETAKAWHDDVYVLLKNTKTDPPSYRWVPGAKLDRPVAYGASVSTRRGVLCIGGNDADCVFADVFLLRWNAETETVDRHPMPSLPAPCTYAGAAAVGDKVYVAGGATGLDLETAEPHFWTIDLADIGAEGFGWRRLPPWPGPPRAFAVVVAQHNGSDDCVYVISGRRVGETGETEFLTDVYEFTPAKCAPDRFDRETGGEDGPWRRPTRPAASWRARPSPWGGATSWSSAAMTAACFTRPTSSRTPTPASRKRRSRTIPSPTPGPAGGRCRPTT